MFVAIWPLPAEIHFCAGSPVTNAKSSKPLFLIFALPGKIKLPGVSTHISPSSEELLLPASLESFPVPALTFAAALFGAASGGAGNAGTGGAGNAFGVGASTGVDAGTGGSRGLLAPAAHCLKNRPSFGSLIALQIVATK